MKRILFFLLLLGSRGAFCQRPVANQATMDTWPTILGENISNDGKFVLYRVLIHPISGNGEERHVEVSSVDGKMKFVFPRARTASFSGDSRWVAVLSSDDSLVIVDLWQRVERRHYAGVRSFKLSAGQRGDAIVAMEHRDSRLIVLNLENDVPHFFERTSGFGFSDSGSYLYVINRDAEDNNGACWLSLVNNASGKVDTVWRGAEVGGVAFDGDSEKVAFLGKDSAIRRFSVWIYDGSRRLLAEEVRGSGGVLGDTLEIQQEELRFLPKLNALTFGVQSRGKEVQGAAVAPAIRVWSYRDEYLKESQEERDREYLNRNFLFVVFLADQRVVQLGRAGDGQGGPRICLNSVYPYAFVVNDANLKEGYRLRRERPNIYLINLRNGSRKCIASHIQFARPVFSPAGKFIIWYDSDEHGYFTYNIVTGLVRSISKDVSVPLYMVHFDQKGGGYYGICNWTEGDQSVLVNDEFDIWKLDPNGVDKPVNLTRGYGRAHGIKFRSVLYHAPSSDEDPFGIGDSVLLCAFDEHTKQNGFFEMYLKGEAAPKRLVMSDDVYYFNGSVEGTEFPYFIRRSAKNNSFLLRKMNAGSYPNVYTTSDFKIFTKISDLEPERTVNWLTVELVHWRTFLGKPAEGILYRPENFDSTKRYPVIVYIYETLSGGLNLFHNIEPSRGPMNIPWFVSRGYLVFCPDIHFMIGDPGAGIYDYVVSGAETMAERHYVDSSHMGIQGHSWGAYEVNYLITRTNLFHAAVSAAGISDLVSLYGLEGFAYGAGPAAVEQQQPRMGVSLGDCPKCYINNSPVFGAGRVETPLFLMHNPNDANVPWEQSLEYYTALRRHQKKVWFVQYANGIHVVTGGTAVLDYTRKMTDFFDFYLKGASCPEWMK